MSLIINSLIVLGIFFLFAFGCVGVSIFARYMERKFELEPVQTLVELADEGE